MKYDFDTIVNRRGTYSLKWDVEDRELPMWVADMDFQTAPEIRQALASRVEHGIFGYSIVPAEWEDAYISWWERRHAFSIQRDWLIFCTGVIPAISSIVRKLTTPGENVVIQTPVYNIFFNSIVNNGRNVLESPLKYNSDTLEYEMDFEDLEKKLKNPQTSLMLLCNPQNPAGKIWSREILEKVGQLCAKYSVVVVSDEIHCDLTDPGKDYIPFASVSEECKNNSITCIAPTKTFNIAGLQTAAVVVPNPVLHHKVWRGLNTDEVAEPNAFAMQAAIAAFGQGEPWLEELRQYIYENKLLVKEFLETELCQVKLTPSDATYLLWLNISQVCSDAEELTAFIRKETGLFLTEGNEYGECGRPFIRMNIACPREVLREGLMRFKQGIQAYLAKENR